MSNNKTSYQLPDLPYDLNALEPVISKEALEIHYTKHHKAYVDKLNEALDKYHEAELKKNVDEMVALQSAIQFNGGGHINHSFFWKCLQPKKDATSPSKDLLEVIEKDFESLDALKEKFNAQATAIQGSGWCWLAYNELTSHLEIITTLNHGTLRENKLLPLLIVDVWEHAYYLQYQNKRADFLKAIWDIVNWGAIERRYKKI